MSVKDEDGNEVASYSIHDMNENQPTKTNKVTKLLGNVLNYMKDYNPNEKFPIYGFGGDIVDDPEKNFDHTSKCFAVGGKIYSPECKGVNNALGAYYSNVGKVEPGKICSYELILDNILGYVEKSKEIPFFEEDEFQEFSVLIFVAGHTIS